ncbi:leucine zipper domain-containing protein [Actinopolyspora biskrensis]|uniref:leucine zipper domain-containing protein n=1 Tax=Actinopolyspora biskrensis TaxID=1470178 RepID=UPI0015CAFB53
MSSTRTGRWAVPRSGSGARWARLNKWVKRYRAEGETGMVGSSNRPHTSPRPTLIRPERASS